MKINRLARLAPAFLVFSQLRAQAPASESFEDLARKASELLDSRPAEAAALYKQALGMRNDWAEGWMSLGGALYQLNRYAECTDAFRRGLALAPRIGPGWAVLGLCEAELGDPEQALADIRKGEQLGLGSNSQFEVAVRVRAAQLLIKSSGFDEAPEQLMPLSWRNEDSPLIQRTMGLAAMAIAADYSELPPERRAVVDLAGKAAWWSAIQKPEAAKAAYEELMKKYPNEPGVHFAYSLYLTETDSAGALAEAQKEAKIDPKNWANLIVLGSLNNRQGDAPASKQALRDALKYAPAKYRWLCHTEMGRAHLIADELDPAISELETAARQMPSSPQVHFFLAQAYRRAGRKEEARKESLEFEKLKAQVDPEAGPGFKRFAGSGRN